MLTDYEKYLENQANQSEIKKRLAVDDIVYIQQDKTISKAQIIKLSEKSAKVKIFDGKEEVKNFPYIKIVKEGDCVALVWEAWRGMQGRGGYRWEREAYENLRTEVESIPANAFVCEEDFLKVNNIYEKSYLEKLNQSSKNKKASFK